ncbi:MAG TPA: hypothetical protein VKB43_01540 [Gaiellaceae bacterium]|nr:hypothetical protein [Gaiellaceae bacterium]
MIDDDDLTDEEVYTFASGEPESVRDFVTLPNGMVLRPGEMLDSDGTRRPNRYLSPPPDPD